MISVARLVAVTAHVQAAWLPLERSGSHRTSGERLAAWLKVPHQAWATAGMVSTNTYSPWLLATSVVSSIQFFLWILISDRDKIYTYGARLCLHPKPRNCLLLSESKDASFSWHAGGCRQHVHIIYKGVTCYWYDMIWYMIWYDIWYDMIWYDMIWYDYNIYIYILYWYDLIYYDMICI